MESEPLDIRNRQLRELLDWTMKLNQSAELLLQPGTIKTTCQTVVRGLVAQFDASWAGVWLLEPSDDCGECPFADACPDHSECLRLQAETGTVGNDLAGCSSVPAHHGLFGQVVLSERKYVSTDVPNDRNIADQRYLPASGMKCLVIFPLLGEGECVGLLVAATKCPWDLPQLAILESYAQLAAGAVANARLQQFMKNQTIELDLKTAELEHVLSVERAVTQQLLGIRQELEARTAEAEAANKTKSAFLASMSHELRTPLNSIIGFAETIDRKIRRGKYDELPVYLKRITGSGRHLLQLINDVLDWSKFRAGGIQLKMCRVNLSDLADRAREHVASQLEEKHQRFMLDAPDGLPLVWADPLRLLQVLINLLANAVKFTQPEGTIGITMRADADQLSVVVWDNGCGIPHGQLDRVFERFEQADRTGKTPGTGLGLAISREIVDLHNGRIWAEQNPGGGSRLCFTLPFRQPAEPEPSFSI